MRVPCSRTNEAGQDRSAPPVVPTVPELVARFDLRRQASTDAFHAGVRLARTGRVSVTNVPSHRVCGVVREHEELSVELYVEDGTLVGRCPCPTAARRVCRHVVALAHAVWIAAPHCGQSSVTASPAAG
jgi:uncharacterized Zn finger protein